ncbi:hypothetical protein BDZ97DRAFT_1709159 [Flammula alnicola]|nr:hypothetical protein BDZ97DRAFT_1709159 [Flammula alnicola]
MKTATDEEKAKERQRRLDARTTRHRHVFLWWPRDPKGKWITPENSRRGKEAPNGQQIWGATLFDFYTVYRFPEMHGLVTWSSGSKLAAWMKDNEEFYARDCIDGAEEEEEPRMIHPCDISQLIKDSEQTTVSKTWVREEEGPKGKGMEREEWEIPQPGLTIIPKLQGYLPHSSFPPKLVVHDPWNLLSAFEYHYREGWDEKKAWSEAQDVTHVYKLTSSTTNTKRREEDDKWLADKEAEAKLVREIFLKNPHSDNKFPSGYFIREGDDEDPSPGPCKPPIFIVLPHKASRFQPPEAHLYLSPAGALGTGNHSFVYKAELELPRTLLVNAEVCRTCVLEDMAKIIQEEDGENGERRDPKWDHKSGRWVVSAKQKMRVITKMKDEDGVEETYFIKPGEMRAELVYEGPFRVIESRVQYQDLALGPYCEHILKEKRAIHPLTSKVYVAAKLSIENDLHLQREAESYQAFPRHFFEHWSGYNVVTPLKEPVPVGPLVPQFYGYYTVDEEHKKSTVGVNDSAAGDGAKTNERPQYLSPILLLEDCGKPIDPKKLSVDDQTECASLIYRFHEAGWLHGSIARRNIVRQPGPLSAWPLERMANELTRGGIGEHWSYRLIDFGRSFSIEGMEQQYRGEMICEESEVSLWVWDMKDLA